MQHFNQPQVKVFISLKWHIVAELEYLKESHSIDLIDWKLLWVVYHQKQEPGVVMQKVHHLFQVMVKQEVPARDLKRIHKIFHDTKDQYLAMCYT